MEVQNKIKIHQNCLNENFREDQVYIKDVGHPGLSCTTGGNNTG